MFTWSVFANVCETISDAGGEHSSMFSERRHTREERVLQGFWKEKREHSSSLMRNFIMILILNKTQTKFVCKTKQIQSNVHNHYFPVEVGAIVQTAVAPS